MDNSYWIQYRNDWCLTKGAPTEATSAKELPAPALQAKKQFTLTVQEIIEESVSDRGIKLLAQSDISHPKIRELILGHLVNGAGLCPSVSLDNRISIVDKY